MFTAFLYRPSQRIQKVESFEELDRAWKDPAVSIWVDVVGPTEEVLRHLDNIVDVDDTALEACLTTEELRPRVDEFPDHIFLLLYGVLAPNEDPTFAPRKLAAFCGQRYLITIHHDHHRTIDSLMNRFVSHGEHLMSRGVDFLLYSIIDGLVDNYGIALAACDEQLEELEEQSLTTISEEIFAKASHLRRELLELRRLALSQREVLGPLARGECDYVAESLGRRFSHVVNHLTKTVELTDSLREILNSVRENYQSGLTRRTNVIIQTLTIFASILLPMSLIAGIYGMNLATWPSMDHPWGFWAVISTMGLLATTLGLFFRSRKWM